MMIIITSKIFKRISGNNYIKNIDDDNNYIKKYSKGSVRIIKSKNIHRDWWE